LVKNKECPVKDLADKAIICTNEEYHADRTAISSSGLRTIFQQSPAHFKYYQDNPKPPTPDMRIGTYTHSAILEPHIFAQSVVIDVGSRAAKAFKDAVEKHPNKLVMLTCEHEQAIKIRDAVFGHFSARNLLRDGMNEQSYFWTDPETGVKCKFRPDSIHPQKIGIDLKTCLSAKKHEFSNSIGKYRYDMQAAFYLEGLSQITGEQFSDFTFIVAEREAPYEVATFRLNDADLKRGLRDVKEALRLYAKCLEADMWPGYPQEIQPISAPRWLWNGE